MFYVLNVWLGDPDGPDHMSSGPDHMLEVWQDWISNISRAHWLNIPVQVTIEKAFRNIWGKNWSGFYGDLEQAWPPYCYLENKIYCPVTKSRILQLILN